MLLYVSLIPQSLLVLKLGFHTLSSQKQTGRESLSQIHSSKYLFVVVSWW